jgi:ribonuclease G
MKREILINAAARETRIAILEDDRLVELLVDRPDTRRMIGDIYVGKVEAVLPGIQAAFVNIGTEKSAFLHASDVQADDPDDDSDPDDHDDDEAESSDGHGNGAGNGAGNGNSNGGNGGHGRRGGKVPPIQDTV